jgi:hypothetical protein
MRLLVLPLSALALASTICAQNAAPLAFAGSRALQLPVTVEKTIEANKVHAGDSVRFRLEQPTLVGNGVVMPTGTILVGEVIESVALQNGSPSKLSVIVGRAEWKQQSIPLRAFIGAFGIRRAVFKDSGFGCRFDAESASANVPGALTRSGRNSTAMQSSTSCDDWKYRAEAMERDQQEKLKDVKLVRHLRDGSTELVSLKKNIKLSNGMLLILQNEPLTEATSAQQISQK